MISIKRDPPDFEELMSERVLHPFGAHSPDTTVVSEATKTPTTLPGKRVGKNTVTTREGLSAWYGGGASKIRQLPGMQQDIDRPILVGAAPEIISDVEAKLGYPVEAIYNEDIIFPSKASIPRTLAGDINYGDETIAHEMAHDLIDRSPVNLGEETVLSNMPSTLKTLLDPHTTLGSEVAAQFLALVRTPPEGSAPFAHPVLNKKGFDEGVKDIVNGILDGDSGTTNELRRIAIVAKKYPPLMNYIKNIYKTYGQVISRDGKYDIA